MKTKCTVILKSLRPRERSKLVGNKPKRVDAFFISVGDETVLPNVAVFLSMRPSRAKRYKLGKRYQLTIEPKEKR